MEHYTPILNPIYLFLEVASHLSWKKTSVDQICDTNIKLNKYWAKPELVRSLRSV